jgi:hypothetical protein
MTDPSDVNADEDSVESLADLVAQYVTYAGATVSSYSHAIHTNIYDIKYFISI